MSSTPIRRVVTRVCAAGVVAAVLGGCEAIPQEPEVETPPRGENADASMDRKAFERLKTDAHTVYEADIDEILPARLDKGGSIPHRSVGPIFVEQMSALELLRILVRPHDIAVVPSPGMKDVKITLLDPIKRPMGEAISMIADQAGLFYEYRDGVLKIDDTRTFTVDLRHMAEIGTPGSVSPGNSGSDGGGDTGGTSPSGPEKSLLETFEATFESMGASDINVDAQNGLVNFVADRKTYRNIAEYTKKVAESKSVIVYDTWIYSVTLEEEVGIGVDFTEFTGSVDGTGIEVKNSESLLGSVGETGLGTEMGLGGFAMSVSEFSVGNFAINALLSFLDNQGKVKALSKPSLTVTSGKAADIFVGNRQNYIRKVEVDIQENLSDDDDGDTTTIEPQIEELNLGIGMALAGSYHNGVIDSKLKLKISELVKLDEREFENDQQSVTLQLPETSERSLNTQISSRPGDIIVLGGLITDNGSLRGQDLLTVPTSRKETKRREELIIVMRPRLVQLRPSGHPDLVAYQERRAEARAERARQRREAQAESERDADADADTDAGTDAPVKPVEPSASDAPVEDGAAPAPGDRTPPTPKMKPTAPTPLTPSSSGARDSQRDVSGDPVSSVMRQAPSSARDWSIADKAIAVGGE